MERHKELQLISRDRLTGEYANTLAAFRERIILYDQTALQAEADGEFKRSGRERIDPRGVPLVGSARRSFESIEQCMWYPFGPDQEGYYSSGYVKLGIMDEDGSEKEEVLTAFSLRDSTNWVGTTDTPAFSSDAEFHASLLWIPLSERLFPNDQDKRTVMTSVISMLIFLEEDGIGYTEQVVDGEPVVHIDILNNPNNPRVARFIEFIEKYQMSLFKNDSALQFEIHEDEQTRDPRKALIRTTIPTRRFDDENVCYMKGRKKRPNIAAKVTVLDGFSLQTGSNDYPPDGLGVGKIRDILSTFRDGAVTINGDNTHLTIASTRRLIEDIFVTRQLEENLRGRLMIGKDLGTSLKDDGQAILRHEVRSRFTSTVGFYSAIESVVKMHIANPTQSVPELLDTIQMLANEGKQYGLASMDTVINLADEHTEFAIPEQYDILDIESFIHYTLGSLDQTYNKGKNPITTIIDTSAIEGLPDLQKKIYTWKMIYERAAEIAYANARAYNPDSPITMIIKPELQTVMIGSEEVRTLYLTYTNTGTGVEKSKTNIVDIRDNRRLDAVTSGRPGGTGTSLIRLGRIFDKLGTGSPKTDTTRPSPFFGVDMLENQLDIDGNGRSRFQLKVGVPVVQNLYK